MAQRTISASSLRQLVLHSPSYRRSRATTSPASARILGRRIRKCYYNHRSLNTFIDYIIMRFIIQQATDGCLSSLLRDQYSGSLSPDFPCNISHELIPPNVVKGVDLLIPTFRRIEEEAHHF